MTDSVLDNVVLVKCIKDILAQIKPVEDDRNKRLSAISELESCVHSVTALQGAAVKPFGSFVSDLYSKSGDLDLSIQLWSGTNFPINKKRKQNVLREVRRALLTRGVAGYMQLILHARVPVLQYVSNRFDISCDISIDNDAGRIKSKIFYWVNTLDERFGDMVLLVKEWAKAHNINDPKSGSLNSYSLCLLVLFHFQTSQPPILPPLKEIYEGNITEDTAEVASYSEEEIDDLCAANIARFRLQNKDPKNESSLCRLLATFFRKVKKVCLGLPLTEQEIFDRTWFRFILTTEFIHIDGHSDEVISTYTGHFERTEDNPCRMKKPYHLFVEDPVERPDNAARAVSMKGLQRITCAFNDAYQKFDSLDHVDRNELLELLCTPSVGAKLGGRVMANSFRNGPQRSHQQIRALGHVGRNRRFEDARVLHGSRPVQRNQQATSTARQTTVQANRVRETGNHNYPHAYMTGHQAAPYQNHYNKQAYMTGYQASPYQNHYYPQVRPAEPYQNHNQRVHNSGARTHQSPNQFHTQVLPTAGTYQNYYQQVYYPGSQAAGLYQNHPQRNGYMSNHQSTNRHAFARTVNYRPVRGQPDNGSAWELRSQASNSAASQR